MRCTGYYTTEAEKGAFGTHCSRRSFVTLALAAGKTEDYVRQRTGHTTDERTLRELELGEVAPMVGAIPKLAAVLAAQGGGQQPIRPSDSDELVSDQTLGSRVSAKGGT